MTEGAKTRNIQGVLFCYSALTFLSGGEYKTVFTETLSFEDDEFWVNLDMFIIWLFYIHRLTG